AAALAAGRGQSHVHLAGGDPPAHRRGVHGRRAPRLGGGGLPGVSAHDAGPRRPGGHPHGRGVVPAAPGVAGRSAGGARCAHRRGRPAVVPAALDRRAADPHLVLARRPGPADRSRARSRLVVDRAERGASVRAAARSWYARYSHIATLSIPTLRTRPTSAT